MRLFVAMELPEDVRRRLAKVQDSLREAIVAKWIPVEQMHLTLKFLGETPDQQLPEIIERLKTIHFDPIRLSTAGLVCFPPHGPIRIVAAELRDSEQKCAALQTEIDQACHAAGFKLEGRRWLPHVTLGRVKERLPGAARELVAKQNVIQEFFSVNQFLLIESRLDRQGPQYVTVAHFHC
jgi:2'-5' RNA ligase